MKLSASVPAFLSKLWTLLEDADTKELICWSQEGNSFLVLDERRFAKEVLPRFFKHNNMASFIRQLNMYGFRKVLQVDPGLVKQEKDGPVEFQHPHFKQGQAELLDLIKRKVSNTRPEESKIKQEDLSNILASVQTVHTKQETMDARLAALKRENEALWRGISDLRHKHAHQQQVIKKLIHFIVTLVQNNQILNLKRKRPILMNSNGKKTKYIQKIYEDGVCVEQSSVTSLSGVKSSETSDDLIICDVTENEAEVTAEVTADSSRAPDQSDVEIVGVDLESCTLPPAETDGTDDAKLTDESHRSFCLDGGAMQLNKASSLSLEDPLKMMDSILKENGAISQNINLLGKMELMDYLDSIDCSLEDFQAMLYGKQFGVDVDVLEEGVACRDNTAQPIRGKGHEHNTDKQLIQFTSCPLVAFFDGCTHTTDLDASSSTSSFQSTSGEAEPSELLGSDLEAERPPRSSLIRLEPLTEAEASQETLFYLCELSPAAQLDAV
ncbi:heat shock factor protein 2 [Genypterus blacodes]|uniref:heat shock factor protein 2 n=1 Tax=Genypterus blacodes TaxID=154954 RepID=UPI003F76437A